jgi:hypothetical protein
VRLGRTFTVRTPDAAAIAEVSLIRLPSVTHAFDQNQRFLRLGVSATATGVRVSTPVDPNVCPPGHYLLFLLDANGIPSVARVVLVRP